MDSTTSTAARLAPPPIEFSIETVGTDCQFTKVVRFQLGEAPTAGGDALSTADRQVVATTVYLDRNLGLDPSRTCSTASGRSEVRPLR